jgi:hypothetical protein
LEKQPRGFPLPETIHREHPRKRRSLRASEAKADGLTQMQVVDLRVCPLSDVAKHVAVAVGFGPCELSRVMVER